MRAADGANNLTTNHVSHPEIIASLVRSDAAAHRGAAGARRTVRERAAGNHATRPVAHLNTPWAALGLRAGAVAARGQANVLQAQPADGWHGGRIHPARNSWCKRIARTRRRPDQSQARGEPPPRAGPGLFQPDCRSLRPRLRAGPFMAGLRAFATADSPAVDRG